MYKFSLQSLLVAPALLGAAVLVSLPATAQVRSNSVETSQVPSVSGTDSSVLNQVRQYSNEGRARKDGMSQLTSISQLSDVQPSDWAFQALQSLVERYGCIAGYPDGTYRGSRPLTRYEFAAGLNACMDRVNELIAAATADLVTKEDLETLRRLQEEFAAELATLRGRVDALEARTAKLEAQQFSTTTKLRGEAIFAIIDAFGDASTNTAGDVDNYNTTFGFRTRINFDTSFTGTDRLRTRLEAGNVIDPDSVDPGREGRLGFTNNSNGAVNIGALEYRFNLNRQTRITISATGREFNDLLDTVSPFEPSESGALSRFGRFNPIYRTGNDKGVAVSFALNNAIRIEGAYLASLANDPTPGRGLFNGPYAALGQVILTPFQGLKVGLTYVNGYGTGGIGNGTGSVTSNLAGNTSYNSYGAQASFQLSRNLIIGGWGGFTAGRVIGRGDADIWNWAGYVAFPDLGGKGNLGGIIVGQQPKLTGTSGLGVVPTAAAGGRADRDTGLHIEGLYRVQLSDNIAVTPGVIWLTAPNHDDRNGDIFIGTIRTTFTF